MKLRFFLSLILIFAVNQFIYADTRERHVESNGFIWEEVIQPFGDGTRRNYYSAYDKDGKLLFSKKRDPIHFMNVDENDEGQFVRDGGIYDRNGNCISPPLKGVTSFIKRFRADNKYYYITMDNNRSLYEGMYGIVDEKGNTIVSPRYYEIRTQPYPYGPQRNLEGVLIVVTPENPYHMEGLINLKGEYIIKPEKDIKIRGNDKDNFITAKHGSSGAPISILDYNGNIILSEAKKFEDLGEENYVFTTKNGEVGMMSHSFDIIISPSRDIKDISRPEEIKGRKFYKVKSADDRWGFFDENGKMVLPSEFEYIDYIGGDYFKFRSGDFWGVVDINSNVIIPTSRGYTDIGKYSSIQKTIPFTKGENKGECNTKGKEIAIHKAKNLSTVNNTSKNSRFFGLKDGKHRLLTMSYGSDTEVIRQPNSYAELNGNDLSIYMDGLRLVQFTIKNVKEPDEDGLVQVDAICGTDTPVAIIMANASKHSIKLSWTTSAGLVFEIQKEVEQETKTARQGTKKTRQRSKKRK